MAYSLAVVSSPSLIFCFFSSRRRHTRFDCDWSSDVCSSDLGPERDEARHLDGHERGQRERAGHRQVAGRGGAPGKQTEQVAVENEEEEREDVRGELLAAVTDVGDRDVVSYEQQDRKSVV